MAVPVSIVREPLQLRRIALFLAFAFGIAWAFGLIIYLTGGLANSPQLIPGTPITLALLLLAGGYMMAPALAHVLVRLLTREGWQATWLRPRLRQGWPFWLAGLGVLLVVAFFPQLSLWLPDLLA